MFKLGWVRSVSAAVFAGALSAGVAHAATITFNTPDGDASIEVGEVGAGFSSFATDGANTGSFSIADPSISQLFGNVNLLPQGGTISGISIDGGATIGSISPSLPASLSGLQSVTFYITGLSIGTYNLTFTTSGVQQLSGQVSRVPTPGTMALLGLGLVGLGFARRRANA